VNLWTEAENVQMGQAGNLRLEAQSRPDFFLRKFELALFVLPDVSHPHLAAEISIDSVFSRVYRGCEALKPLRSLSYLLIFRGNRLQAPINMFEFVLDAL
jgi:hypothetical protein